MPIAESPPRPSVARLIFWSVLLFTCVMATLPNPPQALATPSDKINHVLAFLVLTALHKIAYRSFGFWRRMLVMAVLGGAIEVAQMIPDLHRDAEWLDWAADVGAAFVASVLVAIFLPRRRAE